MATHSVSKPARASMTSALLILLLSAASSGFQFEGSNTLDTPSEVATAFGSPRIALGARPDSPDPAADDEDDDDGNGDFAAGQKRMDPASGIFVPNSHDGNGDGEENMARFFFAKAGSFNTTVAFTVPLLTLLMPDFGGVFGRSLDDTDLGFDVDKLFSVSSLGFLASGGLALLPYILGRKTFGGRSHDADADSPSWTSLATDGVGKLESAVGRFAAALGDQCAKRAVCEAHSYPSSVDRDGDGAGSLLSAQLRAAFPVPRLDGRGRATSVASRTSEIDVDDDGEELFANLTPFELAALYGRSEGADCGDQYKLCFLSLFETSQALSTFFGNALDNFVRRK